MTHSVEESKSRGDIHPTMMYFCKPVLFAVLLILIVGAVYNYYYPPEPAVAKIARSRGAINIDDPNLKYEIVASGLKSPTTMAFLGPCCMKIMKMEINLLLPLLALPMYLYHIQQLK
jgi:hypothetical protein